MKHSATRKPSHPRDAELRQLQAEAVRARKECDDFNDEYSRKHLQDHRLSRVGLTLVDGNARDDSHPGTEERRAAERQRAQDDFRADSQRREELRRAAFDAERAFQDFENAIAEEVDEGSERAELAAAIKRQSEQVATVAKLRKTYASALAAVETAKTRSHDAAAAVNAAIAHRAHVFEAAIDQGYTADRDGMVRDARAEAAAAEDDLAIVQRALDAMQSKLADAESVLAEAGEVVLSVAGRILTIGLPKLLEVAAASRTEMIGREKILRYLAQFAPQELCRDVDLFLAKPWLWDHTPAERHQAVAPWLAARNALMANADAPLPTGGK